jgi:hypothetical protein
MLLIGNDDFAQEVPPSFISSCADRIVAVLDDGCLQAILPGYDQSAWVRRLARINIK